ncbi:MULTISPECIES: type II toxin-antitoxin system HicB family antitoxin [Vibrio]|uniref:type II toxin-antitoxin system HicB family antitoxin n=1 Tax=Vibrio TaxID=662 RepID=UPI000DE1E4CC|nr:type II toxin-antitoxin system HicB family antitoxin [Vibrio tarriae]EHK7543362.1 type II toxin-antitoxin system HicB family antitoxin [Vibrio cholerae]RBM48230.1 type II toxin-antitoxin system HicB family antitoxin [Vibrio tarriae]HDZ9478495.1 type II toxin-antitoxin system HicB family antitoxin [Vibrio cholerae]
MLYPIAIEVGNDNHAYGVVVPDIKGCFSAGDTLDEAIINAKEAIETNLELLSENGDLPPNASDLLKLQSNKEYENLVWAVIDIDIEPYMGKSSKINVTLPDLLKKKIDDQVKANSEYKDRSHFLQVAARNELNKLS